MYLPRIFASATYVPRPPNVVGILGRSGVEAAVTTIDKEIRDSAAVDIFHN
jgi:hypothetical protein